MGSSTGLSQRCVMSLGRALFTGKSTAPEDAQPAPRVIRRPLSKLVQVLNVDGNVWVKTTARKVKEIPWKELGLAKPPILETRFYSWGFASIWVRTEVHKRMGLDDLAVLWRSASRGVRRLIRRETQRIGARNESRIFSIVNVVRGHVPENWDEVVVFQLTAPLVDGEISREHARRRLTELPLRKLGDVFAISEFGVFAYFPSLTGRSGHRARKKMRRSLEYSADLALAQRLVGENPRILTNKAVADGLVFLAPGTITTKSEGVCLDGFFSYAYKAISERLNSKELFWRGVQSVRLVFPPRIFDVGQLYRKLASLGVDFPVTSDVAFSILDREEFDIVLLLAIKEIVDGELKDPNLRAKAICEAAKALGLSQTPLASVKSLARRLRSRDDLKGSLSVPEICLVLNHIDESSLYSSGGGIMNRLVAKGYVRNREVNRSGRGYPKAEVYVLTELPQLHDLRDLIREIVKSIAWRALPQN